MAHPEFDKANAIKRGKFKMDVVTNVVRLPGGKLVPLTLKQTLVFVVHNPPTTSASSERLAGRAKTIILRLDKVESLWGQKIRSLSEKQFVARKCYLKKKLPGWPKK